MVALMTGSLYRQPKPGAIDSEHTCGCKTVLWLIRMGDDDHITTDAVGTRHMADDHIDDVHLVSVAN